MPGPSSHLPLRVRLRRISGCASLGPIIWIPVGLLLGYEWWVSVLLGIGTALIAGLPFALFGWQPLPSQTSGIQSMPSAGPAGFPARSDHDVGRIHGHTPGPDPGFDPYAPYDLTPDGIGYTHPRPAEPMPAQPMPAQPMPSRPAGYRGPAPAWAAPPGQGSPLTRTFRMHMVRPAATWVMQVVFLALAAAMFAAGFRSPHLLTTIGWSLAGLVVLVLVALTTAGLASRVVSDADGLTLTGLRRRRIRWADVAELRIRPSSRTSFESGLDVYRVLLITRTRQFHVITPLRGTHAEVSACVAEMLGGTSAAVAVDDRPVPPPPLRVLLAAQRQARRSGRD